MSTSNSTRRHGTGIALAAVLGLGTSFGLMTAPASADPGNGQGQGQGTGNGLVHAPGQQAPATTPVPQPTPVPQSTPVESPGGQGTDTNSGGKDKSKDKDKDEDKGAQGHGNPGGNPGKPEGNPGQGDGNPGKSEGNPGKSEGNPGQGHGNPGKSEGNPGRGHGNPGQGHANPGTPGNSGTPGNPGTGHGSTNEPGDTPAEGDPAGNNGTIKIVPLGGIDAVPDNNPHVGCQLYVEWYGFDADAASPVLSTVSFELQAPTTDGTLSVSGLSPVPVGGDAQSGAGTDTGLDGRELYTLSFTGTPHPQQGHHVKVTVSTPFAHGNDTKSKVLWVEPCATPPVPPTDTTTTTTDTTTDTTTTTTPAPTPVTEAQTDVLGVEATTEDTEETTQESTEQTTENVVAVQQTPGVEVLGEQAAVLTAVANTVLRSPSNVTVPTVVNAGIGGTEAVRNLSATQSLLALMMLLLAGASARLAWTRRAGA